MAQKMKRYILHRTFVSKDGSCYQQRSKPYYESELPELALSPLFATLVDDGVFVETIAKPIEKNVVDSHYNAGQTPNVVEQHFEPSYAQVETPVAPAAPVVDLAAMNSPDHVVQEVKPVYLQTATVEQITALPYISRKTAEKIVEARDSGTVFSSMADLDAAFKLGFGRRYEETGLKLVQNND